MDTSRTITHTIRPTTRQRAAEVVSVVTPLAWGAIVAAVVALVVGRRLGWEELVVIGATLAILLLASLLFTVGRAELAVDVEVKPNRVQAGQRSAALVTVANASGGRMLPVALELRVGDGVTDLQVPILGSGSSHEELFILPTVRRAVIPVGPATSVRSDPLGLLRRTRTWAEVQALVVHPNTVSLAELASGFVRDLEGRPTDDISPADVAFHTLREYEPGDDRRYVHPLTSARVGKLMVRQFNDTRRSHVGIVVDAAPESYSDADEVETAISVAGSLGVRVLRDEQELSVVVGGDRIPAAAGVQLLDGLAAAATGPRKRSLPAEVDHLFRFASGLSTALVVTGTKVPLADVRGAVLRFPSDVRVIAVQVDHGGAAEVRPFGDHTLVRLPGLSSLGELLWRAAS